VKTVVVKYLLLFVTFDRWKRQSSAFKCSIFLESRQMVVTQYNLDNVSGK